MGRTGAFGAFAAAANAAGSEPSKNGNYSSIRRAEVPAATRSSRATPSRPAPSLSLEEVRALLEELRTVSSSAKFQKDLQHLRSLDWGAFKKREAVAKLLSIFWKAPLRRFGFGIDGQGFPHLLQVVKANGTLPGIRLVSHEVEKQLRMVPGTLFGLTADVKNWKDEGKNGTPLKSTPNESVTNGKVADVRGRPMFLGEAKEILKAFKEALLSAAVLRTMQNIEQKGGVHMDQHRRVLITQEWNPIMKRFDFPITEAGYEAMRSGVRQFAENDYVRSCCHEVEGLCGAPPGSYFGVPTAEEMAAQRALEEKRKAEEAKKVEEKRKAEEEERRRIEAEKRQAEEVRKKKEEEETRKRQEEEAAKRKEEEERRQEEQAAKRKEEEETRRRQEEEEAKREDAEETSRQQEEEAAEREEAEETSRRQEEEDTKRKVEEETSRRQEEEDTKRKVEEETSRRQEEEDTKRKVEEETSRRQEEEDTKRKVEEETSRRQEEEDAKRKVEEETSRRQEEEAARGKEEETTRMEKETGHGKKDEDAGLGEGKETPVVMGKDPAREAMELPHKESIRHPVDAGNSEEPQRQTEEEKRIVNGDAKLEADRESAAKRPVVEKVSEAPVNAQNDSLHGSTTHRAPRLLPLLRNADCASDAVGVLQPDAVVRGVVEGNWLRVLPSTCRTVGALADTCYILLEELQPAPSTSLGPLPVGSAGRFVVRAEHVAVRAHPELHGKVVGVVVAGRMLMGTPHKVAGYLWLRFEESSRKKVGDEEAWALVQDLQGTVLLEPLDADGRRALSNFQGSLVQRVDQTEPAEKADAHPPAAVRPPPTAEKMPTPVTDPVKVAQRVDAAALARKQLKGPLEFRVLAEDHSAPVRKEPLVQSPQVGKLDRGEVVYGYPGGGWLQLMNCELENSWVFIGTRLSAVWAELRVTARSWNALEVTWPGLYEEKRVAYNVEWRTPEGAPKQMKGHKVSAGNKVVLGNLPAGLLCFRVGARVAGAGNNDDQDVKLWGSWAELEAGED